MAYTVLNIDEVEPGSKTGVVKLVRRELGLEAFSVRRGSYEARGPF
jgi:hypothetical protein